MLKINDARMQPNPVEVEKRFLVIVEIITWGLLKRKHIWNSLETEFGTWKGLRERAVTMDFSKPNWDSVKDYRTWNSMARYGINWDELKGE